MSERPSPLVEALQGQERAWQERPLVRSLYDEWYRLIAERLSTVPGDSVELGSGIATLQRVCPQVRPTDVEPTRGPNRSWTPSGCPTPTGRWRTSCSSTSSTISPTGRPSSTRRAGRSRPAAASSSSTPTARRSRPSPTGPSTASAPTSRRPPSRPRRRSRPTRSPPTRRGPRSSSSAASPSSAAAGPTCGSSSGSVWRPSSTRSRAASPGYGWRLTPPTGRCQPWSGRSRRSRRCSPSAAWSSSSGSRGARRIRDAELPEREGGHAQEQEPVAEAS